MTPKQKIFFLYRKFKHFFFKRIFRFFILHKFYVNPIRKLHLGCGERLLQGWLNADIYNGDIYLDITKKLPFKSNSIDLVYSHHVIEHITLAQFKDLIAELYRVMKPGAWAHIVTPDLKKIVHVYSRPEEHEDLIEYYCKDDSLIGPAHYVNVAMRQEQEHLYIYDFTLLQTLFQNVGFREMVSCEYGESRVDELKGIDDHGYKMIDKISLTIELKK